ncbi:hypothetical protein AB6809_29630 [Paraburkholderia sp. RCC_158]|uniref:hypothetical protein n=1 Tax=Paraburkholderia sp. RCC_158 TaxID=3239220 RepID=UPI0035255A55
MTQGNRREYPVHTENKARVASNCGYTVERIDDAPAAESAAPASCAHRIVDARNEIVKSGYLCIDCGAVFAGIHPQTAQADRIAELERERDHWKANHDAQVERARVLMERTDVPVERTRAYQHMRTLQRLVEVQKMLLEAFTGQLEAPADFNACTDDPIPAFPHSLKRLTDAYCVQQPLPVPDQMALVYRVDIGRLRGAWIHKNAYFENTVPHMQAIRAAIQDYHFALDTRAHSGVAMDNAFRAICNALGMHWEQGAEKARRDANAASGQSNHSNEQREA